jgi:hypothetical protein
MTFGEFNGRENPNYPYICIIRPYEGKTLLFNHFYHFAPAQCRSAREFKYVYQQGTFRVMGHAAA